MSETNNNNKSDLKASEKKKITHFTKKKRKTIGFVSCIIIIAIIVFFATGNLRQYNKAEKFLKNGKYQEARKIFDELEDYKDSNSKVCECDYQKGLSLIEKEQYSEALEIFSALLLSQYKDTADQINFCKYEIAKQNFTKQDYIASSKIFKELSNSKYKDSEDLYKQSMYILGKQYAEKKQYDEAVNCLQDLNYEDSEAILASIVNGENSINKFVERYNAMTAILKEKQGVTIPKLDVSNLTGNQITTGIGATVTFNMSADDVNCKYNIVSFMWSKSPWILTDSYELTGDMYCCLAGYLPENDYETIGNIMDDIIIQGSKLYASSHYNGYFYTFSQTKKETTIAGQIDGK